MKLTKQAIIHNLILTPFIVSTFFIDTGIICLMLIIMLVTLNKLFIDIHLVANYSGEPVMRSGFPNPTIIISLIFGIALQIALKESALFPFELIFTLICLAIVGFYVINPFSNQSIKYIFMVFAFISVNAITYLLSTDITFKGTLYTWLIIVSLLHFIISVQALSVLNSAASIRKDIGTYLFAFSILWVYFFYSEVLIKWYGNLPDDIKFIQDKLTHNLPYLMLLIACNFIFPFMMLFAKKMRSDKNILIIVAMAVIIGQLMFLIRYAGIAEALNFGIIFIALYIGLYFIFIPKLKF